MITSAANPRVKNIIQLTKKMKSRKEQGVFIAEGLKMFREAPREAIREVFVSQTFAAADEHLRLLGEVGYEVVADRVFAQMADTRTPQGILCVIRQFCYRREDMLAKPAPFLLLLENLQDPGNLGTIFRTAEGAGVDGIIMSQGCVDIYNPKTIRATMGSIYRVPFSYEEHLSETVGLLRARKIRSYAAHLDGTATYDRPDYRAGTAFLIGNEGNGLSCELSAEADQLLKIPMEGQLESLNAAVAAAILMYEVHRQRNETAEL